MKPAAFIAMLLPAAAVCELNTGIPAAFTVAQGALESAWGESQLAVSARNLFGVKADNAWHGETVAIQTAEFIGGKRVFVPARWRKYPDWQSCIDDHAKFLLSNPRYKHAFEHCADVETFAREIQKAGYATDPDYADKIIRVIKSHAKELNDRGA